MIEIKKNVSLKQFSTFKIGGKAKYLIKIKSLADLTESLKFCKQKKLNFKIIGCGSNLLFDDKGYSGAILVNQTNKIFKRNNFVYADSGVNINNLINYCCKLNLSGIENLSGIPSTVGGAIYNNSGAFGVEISDFVQYVVVLRLIDNKILKLNKNECNFKYRSSKFKNNDYIILKVKFCFSSLPKKEIEQKIKEILEKKHSTQPLNYPSAGSIFKRTEIIPAKVIDELNLKGKKVGKAQISTKHAGFIVNLGNAKAKHVKNLILKIKKIVKEQTNHNLIEEIEIVPKKNQEK